MATEQTTSPRCEPCSLLRLLRKTTRTPRSCRPITLAHCHTPVPAAALVSSSSRDSPPAVSPSTDPVRPHRPAGSTHHDDANATQHYATPPISAGRSRPAALVLTQMLEIHAHYLSDIGERDALTGL